MEIFTLSNLVALLALTALEIALGVDNIIVLSIVVGKLKPEQQALARRIGLGLALLGRIFLLLMIGWVMRLTDPLFPLFDHAFSGRDLILLPGGLFLIAKATYEIHTHMEAHGQRADAVRPMHSFGGAILQIVLLDLVFSLDSVITAVGMVNDVPIMIAAVVLAIGLMLVFARSVGDFIDDHPTIKMLALAFLLLIGVILTAEGLGKHIDKGYIYFAMGFSLLVEILNLRVLKKVRA